MGQRHFLAKAYGDMIRYGHGHLWMPGTTAWSEYGVSVSASTIQRAIRQGYLHQPTQGSYAVLTVKGWRTF